MSNNEPTLNKEVIYNGKIINVELHEVELPNGNKSKREIVYHNGAVAVCALNADNEVILVKQFRKPLEKPLVEIPAGKLEKGEDREDAAKRELKEETGYEAESLTLIANSYGTPGFSNELISIYMAEGLTKGEVDLDDDEFVEHITLPIDKVKEALQNQEFEDAKTIIALQYLLLNYNHYK
ncbi:NUDIX hydrolase [Staphylococcus massiliensis]|uniref:NUDIX hydrolase n=1 Tax=Staphylococcus massiliensis TaxID=555791 RepID=UPI001EDE9DBC|nr:NUDIX hydrolase [Staphylococcus massiliensis]MCG3401072.1 NUDIX hydrolase [Staphylococcus massiliensis]